MKNILLLLIPVGLFMSCGKGAETVTVRSSPSELFESSDTLVAGADAEEESFAHLRLGEIAAIESLDPLFAESYSEFRVLNLIYQGLVTLDDNGQTVPALAKSWTVNNDSTRFTFHLDTRAYFHDSPVFSNGNGRRVVADDVKFIFNRMAFVQVPRFAGNYFNDIRGFKNYRNELMYVKNPAKQVIDSVEGISVQNDSTIVFDLNSSAPDFLYRLAHPRASVYAKESVPEANGPLQRSVGSGAFYFVKQEDSTHILALNDEYRGEKPELDRLDIISGLDESALFQNFVKKQLDALIETGPSTMLTIADSAGNLQSGIYPHFKIVKSTQGASAIYSLFFNQRSGQQQNVYDFISSLDVEALTETDALGRVSISHADSTSPQSRPDRQFIVTHTEHKTMLYLISKVAQAAVSRGISFGMLPSYAISDDVTFTARPYPGTKEVLRWRYPVYVLSGQRVSGIKVLYEPWKLDLSEIVVKEEE